MEDNLCDKTDQVWNQYPDLDDELQSHIDQCEVCRKVVLLKKANEELIVKSLIDDLLRINCITAEDLQKGLTERQLEHIKKCKRCADFYEYHQSVRDSIDRFWDMQLKKAIEQEKKLSESGVVVIPLSVVSKIESLKEGLLKIEDLLKSGKILKALHKKFEEIIKDITSPDVSFMHTLPTNLRSGNVSKEKRETDYEALIIKKENLIIKFKKVSEKGNSYQIEILPNEEKDNFKVIRFISDDKSIDVPLEEGRATVERDLLETFLKAKKSGLEIILK